MLKSSASAPRPLVSVESRRVSVDEALDVARSWQLSGRLAEAESVFRRVLAAKPENDVALYHLGLIAHQNGKIDLAAKLIGKAAKLKPAQPAYHNDLGLLRIKQGKLDEAASHLETALALDPDAQQTYCNLGRLRLAQSDHQAAIASFQRAAALDPRSRTAILGLGQAFFAEGNLDSSAASLRRVIELEPGDVEAHSNLGLVLRSQGRLEEAADVCRRATNLNPRYALAHNNLGLALQALGRLEEAAACYRKASELDPGLADAHNNLGAVLNDQGDPLQASMCIRRALAAKPDFVEAHINLGRSFRILGKLGQAIASLKKALSLDPASHLALNDIGAAYHAQGLLDRARISFEKALAIKPNSALTITNLGATMLAFGDPLRALAHFRRAIEIEPDYLVAHQSLLLCMNYLSETTASALYAEHAQFGERFETPLKLRRQPHLNVPNVERKLKIGYVSGDFHRHPVADMVEPVLAKHDKATFEVYCYSSDPSEDEVTGRMKVHADHWRRLVGRRDDDAAKQVRDDGIDILVDLSGHTANNCLLVFARKPAPVQVSWLGYATTTGLSAIDYRITDSYADPPGRTEAYHTETLWRLPSVTVFRPDPESPPVGPLPVLETGQFTFACFNNVAKLTPDTIALWARILTAVPNSRLLIGNTADRGVHERLLGEFNSHSVAGSRLAFKPPLPRLEYFSLHHQIDLALDPFPYNGAGTSCHSLWMGVPFVTLTGDRYMSRMGVSLLSNVGLVELIAGSYQEYFDLACALARDSERLAGIRSSLRDRMRRSLCDADAFVLHLESAYRDMWRRWCVRY